MATRMSNVHATLTAKQPLNVIPWVSQDCPEELQQGTLSFAFHSRTCSQKSLPA